jgi:hypothetical protein
MPTIILVIMDIQEIMSRRRRTVLESMGNMNKVQGILRASKAIRHQLRKMVRNYLTNLF